MQPREHRLSLCPELVPLVPHSELMAVWEDSDNSGMANYADKDELVIYTATVRGCPLALRKKVSVAGAALGFENAFGRFYWLSSFMRPQ